MSDDDAEIIPPRKGLPAKRPENTPASMNDVHRLDTGGIVGSTITRWTAKSQSRAIDEIAKRYRSEADALKAYGEVADAFENTARKVNRLRHLPENIALDDEKWRGDREEEYAELDERRAERAHQADLAKLRRAREIQEANARLVEAKRGAFGASEGLESQERLKQLNLEMWEKRAATEQLDAEKIWLLLKREVEGIRSPSKKAEGSLEQLAEMRESLVQRSQEAAASGDASKAEKYERLAAELDDMVVAALRGQTQR